MSFWSSETLKSRLPKETLVDPYSESRIEHCAYELSLGAEAFITAEKAKTRLSDGEQLVIPPGQFGLLLTKEVVAVPSNALGFISIKAGIKFRGLVNVSGFHIDPGFRGKLKFSVYNAGNQNIVLDHGQRVFLLWFCDLDRPTTDIYEGKHANQADIAGEDVMQIQGEVASPAALKKEIEQLRTDFDKLSQTVTIWRGLTIGLLSGIALMFVVRFLLQP